MKKITLIALSLLFAIFANAGDSDKYLTLGGGWQRDFINGKNSLVAGRIGLEFEKRFNKSTEIFIDYARDYQKYPNYSNKNNKFYFDNNIFTLGFAYKIPIAETQNSVLKINPLGAVATSSYKPFQFGIGADIEYTYFASRSFHIYVAIRNSYMFVSDHNIRNGVYVGFKFNL